jgi:pentapeptide MXKDX repeat protein
MLQRRMREWRAAEARTTMRPKLGGPGERGLHLHRSLQQTVTSSIASMRQVTSAVAGSSLGRRLMSLSTTQQGRPPMITTTRIGLSAAILSFSLALAPAAFAQDKMGKDDGMKKESMSKDAMKKEDGMAKKDGMKHDGMKKDDAMKKN